MTDEQRLKEIREKAKYGGATPNDVDFLLSLVDSQVAENKRHAVMPSTLWISPSNDQDGCFEAHQHKHYDDDVRYLNCNDFNASYEDLLRAASLREQAAITSMRSACIEKVNDKIDDLSRTSIAAEQNAREIHLLMELREELESVTIQEQEKQR